MKKFAFYWRDGHISWGEGETAAEAFTKLGYGNGALAALDFHSAIDGKGELDYEWNEKTKYWDRKTPIIDTTGFKVQVGLV